MNAHKTNAFTLIELLVVVAIIALLTGILVPSLSKARESAKRARCQANLRSVGQAIRTYMDENYGLYPPMGHFREEEQTKPKPRLMMAEVLKSHVGNQLEVFQCPADRITDPGGGLTPPSGVETYFKWQGSSYDPVFGLSVNTSDFNGQWDMSREDRFLQKIQEGMQQLTNRSVDIEDLTKVAIVHDYECFHGITRMALYADFHVAAMSGY